MRVSRKKGGGWGLGSSLWYYKIFCTTVYLLCLKTWTVKPPGKISNVRTPVPWAIVIKGWHRRGRAEWWMWWWHTKYQGVLVVTTSGKVQPSILGHKPTRCFSSWHCIKDRAVNIPISTHIRLVVRLIHQMRCFHSVIAVDIARPCALHCGGLAVSNPCCSLCLMSKQTGDWVYME